MPDDADISEPIPPHLDAPVDQHGSGTCPDCHLLVALYDDGNGGHTWERHPWAGTAHQCPNSGWKLMICAGCQAPITRTMVHGVDCTDGVISAQHLSPVCLEVARSYGMPAHRLWRIDPRPTGGGPIRLEELVCEGAYGDPGVPADPPPFVPVGLVASGDWVDPTEPVARVERERDRILAEAAKIISGDRERDYGSAADGFARTGRIWGAMLGVPDIPAEMVGYMLAGLKLSRLSTTPDHRDSIVDGPGYFALAGEIALNRTATDEEDF